MSVKYKAIKFRASNLGTGRQLFSVQVGGAGSTPGPTVDFSLGVPFQNVSNFQIQPINSDRVWPMGSVQAQGYMFSVLWMETSEAKPDMEILISLAAEADVTSFEMNYVPTTAKEPCTAEVAIHGSDYVNISDGAQYTFQWDAPSS